MSQNATLVNVEFPRSFIPQLNLLSILLVKSRCFFHTECRRIQSKAIQYHASKTTTIKNNEIQKFDKRASIWWEKSSLRRMNVVRVPFVCSGLLQFKHLSKICNPTKPLTGFRILDVGCAGGLLSEPLARLGATVTGLDPATDLIKIALEHAKLDSEIADNLSYICDTVENYKTNVEPFDAIVCSEVIEHVDNLPIFIESCTEILKEGGSLFFTTINQTVWSYIMAILICEYIVGIIPKGTHEWNMFVKPEYLQNLLSKCGCKTVSVQGFEIHLYTREWSLCSSDSGWYALHAVKKSLI